MTRQRIGWVVVQVAVILVGLVLFAMVLFRGHLAGVL